jgi:hypothetical protein
VVLSEVELQSLRTRGERRYACDKPN